jgi:hypothetical protein|tara:strand:+ start:19790 stop:20251 length:462 start_codon:yes stop_codon:yes gene_type:complete
MIKSIGEIIDEVLHQLEDAGIKRTVEAYNLVFETGLAESGYRAIEGYGEGNPAVSFWQLEPETIRDMWDNYISYRKPLIEACYKLGLIEANKVFSVFSNIALASAFCRIYYRRKPGAIPKTMPARAEYWKKHYNTYKGRGTVDHYIGANMGVK